MKYKHLIILSIAVFAAFLCSPTSGFASILLSADNFAVLAGSTVANASSSTVIGDIGVSPGSSITGFGTSTITGTMHSNDAVAGLAQSDLTTAYNGLAGMPVSTGGNLTGQDLGGLTLAPGVYHFNSSAGLTGTLTLDAQGNNNAYWVFQIGSTLTTGSGSAVNIINGGSLGGVYWQVGSSATLGTSTTFEGNILALASITLTTGTTLNGRALARNAAVTMDGNTINNGSSPSNLSGLFNGGLRYETIENITTIVPIAAQGPSGSVVPEPSTMLLFGLGGIATAFIRGRRKA